MFSGCGGRMQRQRALGGFGLSSAVFCFSSRFPYFCCSVSHTAGQSPAGGRPAQLHQWLRDALTSPTIDALLQYNSRAVANLPTSDEIFLAQYRLHPEMATGLQSALSTAATKQPLHARLDAEQEIGNRQAVARLHSARAKHAPRWKWVKLTEEAYQLSD